MKESVSFQGDVFCHGGDGGGGGVGVGVMCEGHTIGHVMDEKFVCDGSEEGGERGNENGGGKSVFLATFLSAVEVINTVHRYP